VSVHRAAWSSADPVARHRCLRGATVMLDVWGCPECVEQLQETRVMARGTAQPRVQRVHSPTAIKALWNL
jgi:hypothetical protein